MNAQRKRNITAVGVTLLLVAMPCVFVARQYHQMKLDRALIAAIRREDADGVDLLLASGANANARDTPPRSVIQNIRIMMRAKPDPWPTALVVAVDPPRVPRIVKDLIAAGADVNAKDVQGNTALDRAAYYDIGECIQILIAAGANVNATSDTETPLYNASDSGNAQVVGILLNSGANVNARLKYGSTALMAASSANHPKILNALLVAGADVNLSDTQGYTALRLTLSQNQSECCRALVSAGADVNAKTFNDFTPLHFAAVEGNPDTIRVLIQAGAKLNARDKWGRTPLDMAISPTVRKRGNTARVIRVLKAARAKM